MSLGSEIDEPFHELGGMSDDIEPEILVCEDEEKTLTASTREDMIRPRLAEIKWTRDDEDDVTQVIKKIKLYKTLYIYSRYINVNISMTYHYV